MLKNSSPIEKIGVLIKTSLVDYPSHVASTIFLKGCNLRCPYCYNTELVNGELDINEAVSFSEIITHLENRRKVLSGIVISGGEALLSPYTEQLILEAKNLGYKVKLDTNGIAFTKLQQLLDNEKLRPDFIALDVKTSPQRYNLLCGNNINIDSTILEKAIKKSISIVSTLPSNSREFRTVLVPTLITNSDIKNIGELLPKDASWQFAPFRNDNCLDKSYNEKMPYIQKEMDELISYAQTFIPNAKLR